MAAIAFDLVLLCEKICYSSASAICPFWIVPTDYLHLVYSQLL